MTTETKLQIKKHLSKAKGESVLADSFRNTANIIGSDNENASNYEQEVVITIKEMIDDNAPVMLDILGEEGFEYFVNYELLTAFAPTANEGTE